MGTNRFFVWTSGALEPENDTGAVPMVVADSWLVAAGRVRAVELHRARFFAAVPVEMRAQLRLDDFWTAMLGAIPHAGAWFPRVELRLDGREQRLAFRLRAAPPLSTTLVAITHGGRDPRSRPGVKGPDLAALADLRRGARLLGADEAVIVDRDGCVVDGASTAILWWRGDALCAPSRSFVRVDSVTARTALAIAAGLGIEIRYEAVRPGDLDGLEVWAVNALHGIRTITTWIDGPTLAGETPRAAVWRARLDALAKPLAPRTVPRST